MSTEAENLTAVRRIFEGWTRNDFSDVSWADPELEFEIARGHEAGIYAGIAEMTRVFAGWLGAFEEFGVEPVDFTASGDHVLVVVQFHGRGKGSGFPVEKLSERTFSASATSASHTSGCSPT